MDLNSSQIPSNTLVQCLFRALSSNKHVSTRLFVTSLGCVASGILNKTDTTCPNQEQQIVGQLKTVAFFCSFDNHTKDERNPIQTLQWMQLSTIHPPVSNRSLAEPRALPPWGSVGLSRATSPVNWSFYLLVTSYCSHLNLSLKNCLLCKTEKTWKSTCAWLS